MNHSPPRGVWARYSTVVGRAYPCMACDTETPNALELGEPIPLFIVPLCRPCATGVSQILAPIIAP